MIRDPWRLRIFRCRDIRASALLAPAIAAIGWSTACSAANPPAVTAAPARPEFIVPNRPNSPFSPVVRVGNTLYVSSQIGTDGSGLAKGGTGPETTAAMKHISSLLEQAGSSLDRVAKCTVMLADMKDWNVMNEAYNAFFPQYRPARSSFGATGLAQGAHVEIECIATVDK